MGKYFVVDLVAVAALCPNMTYTHAIDMLIRFHGVYLGDLERLQDIQKKRDATNRNWQQIILRNIGKSLGWDMDNPEFSSFTGGEGPPLLESRQLWWKIRSKMSTPEYSNMLLLAKMADEVEELMYHRRQKYITKKSYEEMIAKLHLDTEGKVVEPFVSLTDRTSREERERLWYESLALDLEHENLIK